MGISGTTEPMCERWPEIAPVFDVWRSSSQDAAWSALRSHGVRFGDTPEGQLAAAILALRADDYRPTPEQVTRIKAKVASAVELAPDEPYVRLYAAMILLDVWDPRGALPHARALREHAETFTGAKAQAALLHVIGRILSAGGKHHEAAGNALALAVELDPSIEYKRALERHYDDNVNIISTSTRPSVEQLFLRLPL